MWDWKQNPPSVPGDPKKFIKIVISLALGLLVLWIFVMAQTERSDRVEVSEEQEYRLDSLRNALGGDGERVERRTERSDGMFFNAFTTFVILAGLLLAFWWWFSRKAATDTKEGGGGPIAKEVGSQQIGMGQELKVLEINNEYWVLATSNQSVTLLHRYKKDEWNLPEQPAATPGQGGEGKHSFAGILSSFQSRK